MSGLKINIRMEILDSLADDAEGIEQIESLFKVWFNDTITDKVQILAEIKQLLLEKLIYIAHHDKEENYNWYAMTPEGRAMWDTFDWSTYLEQTKYLRREDDGLN
ncbi:MAG: hypothetical protein ACOX05_04620 [Bacillota bacterium]